MKKTTRFLTSISGIFRSIITILFAFAAIFAGFVDKKLLASFLDIIGLSSISLGFAKPFALLVLISLFLLNLQITRNIFNSGKFGVKIISNIFFATLFVIIDLLILFFVRERLILIPLILNVFIILSQIMAMATKGKGYYNIKESKKPTKLKKNDKGVIKERDIEEISNQDIKKKNSRANNKIYSLDFASKKEDEAIKEDQIEEINVIDPDENKENLGDLKDKEVVENPNQIDTPSEDDKNIDTQE
ncbi:hypothetical protein [Anaerococcus sp.]|uniref:hypothetical protein n=1 Tax=Anaerococcus sp. TaxID=1872515 RepID=UPI0027B992AF|nr:hypothetical protein [Anaerococcus sp.]